MFSEKSRLDQLKKSTFELFKEELRLIQEERRERHAGYPAPPVYNLEPLCQKQPDQPQDPCAMMQQQAGSSNDASSPAGASSQQTPPEEARKFSIQRCIQALVHACQCKDVNCHLASCQRMKRVVHHIKTCKKRSAGGCPICKQLVALCCHHARNCLEAKCLVPFCFNIKQKLKHSSHQLHVQEEKMLRQGMALLKLVDPEDSASSSENMEDLIKELSLADPDLKN